MVTFIVFAADKSCPAPAEGAATSSQLLPARAVPPSRPEGSRRACPERSRRISVACAGLKPCATFTTPQPLLCFHTLTKAFSRSSFLLTFLQNPRGCHPPSANSSPVNDSSRCAHRFPNGMPRLSALKMTARQYDSSASWQYNRAAIMALVSGQRPGSNDVRALIGAGGMPPVAQPLLAVRRI